ncbi:hypothetical protein [Hyphomicrobium sp.]|uniref:hypothetical protein n=1 Tax=Hyphomicrobium sp. TaxID=82 RepID=UPI0025BDDE23|nr:hypothetical protein [Hyphomicrobium sp.]MCC7252358.1 hypothetical protein [Hyphomicrobium sp.]
MNKGIDSLSLRASSILNMPADGAAADLARLNRRRGVGSFLTRSFYLGQLIVAQQFVSGAAQAKLTDDAPGDSADGTADTATAGAATSLQGAGLSGEAGASSPAHAIAAKTMAGAPVSVPVHDAPEAGASAVQDGVTAGGGNAVGDGGAVASASVDGEAAETVAAAGPDGTGITLDLDLPLDVGTLTTPVFDLLEGTIELTTGIVDSTFDALKSLPIVSDLLGSTVPQVVDPLLNTVDSIVSGLGDSVGSSGVIQFATNTLSNLQDQFFEGGRYSDLGISIQSELAESTVDVLTSVASLGDTFGDHLDDATFGITSSLHDTAKGGIAELLS